MFPPVLLQGLSATVSPKSNPSWDDSVCGEDLAGASPGKEILFTELLLELNESNFISVFVTVNGVSRLDGGGVAVEDRMMMVWRWTMRMAFSHLQGYEILPGVLSPLLGVLTSLAPFSSSATLFKNKSIY